MLALALVIGATGSTVAPPTSSVAVTPVRFGASSAGELSIDTNQAEHLGETSGYQYVILQDYMYAHVSAIKSADPSTKVLAYLEAPVTQTRTCTDASPAPYAPHDSFGVNYCYAAAEHPEWFLHNLSGPRVGYADYVRDMVMDIGNPVYQNTWAANAISMARTDGFDGVYLDDINTYPGHGIDGQISEYNDQAYGKAMTSFVTTVGDQLRSNGLIVAANVAANPWVAWQRAYGLSIATHLTAYGREHYSRYGDICGPFSERFNTTAGNGTPPLAYVLAYDQAVQMAGAHLVGIDYGYSPPTASDVATMAYGRAAFLLAWDGRAGGAYIYRSCGAVDPKSPVWTIDLGTPTGSAVLAGAVYRRTYSGGLVLLNPSRNRPVTVSIPAGYADAHGVQVSGATTLPPETALLLRSMK
jgi:hypothetical protein